MSPTGGETSRRNARLTKQLTDKQLTDWRDRTELGAAFDSNGGFKLPNGADRAPDAAWVAGDRWNALTSEQREGFVPLCPDFVIELRSRTDTLPGLQAKMQEYLDNGTQSKQNDSGSTGRTSGASLGVVGLAFNLPLCLQRDRPQLL